MNDRRNFLRRATELSLSAPFLTAVPPFVRSGEAPLGIADCFIDVRDHGARGDGRTDDAGAFAAAISAASAPQGARLILIPPGEYVLRAPLSVDQQGITFAGCGYRATLLRYQGSGTAFTVTSSEGVRFTDLHLDNSGSGDIGISYEHSGTTTSFHHGVERVRITKFKGPGFRSTNLEEFLGSMIKVANCGVGFEISNATHESGHLGVDNSFLNCRAQDCDRQGWTVNGIMSSSFLQCQALRCGGPEQFLVGPNTQGLFITGLDVEERSNPSGVGLHLGGGAHVVQFKPWNVKIALRLAGAQSCFVFPFAKGNAATAVESTGGAAANTVIGQSGVP